MGNPGQNARHGNGRRRLGEIQRADRSGLSMVLLDEINIALRYDYIPIEEVVTFLVEEKPK